MVDEIPTDSVPATVNTAAERDSSRTEHALTQVRQALAGLRFGQIAITVQDGVVVQIERIERVRFHRGAK